MIVKNESHILPETLPNLVRQIDFDCWCITDTGSTDGTPKMIETYFAETHPLFGKMCYYKWTNHFGKARTRALKNCLDIPARYVIMFDADDLIEGKFPSTDWKQHYGPLKTDGFVMTVINEDDPQVYPRCAIMKNDGNWKYVRARHEESRSIKKTKVNIVNIDNHKEGGCCIVSRRRGDRSKNPNKLRDDLDALLEEYNTGTAEIDRPGTLFHIARYYTYFDAKESVKKYQECIDTTEDSSLAAQCFINMAKEYLVLDMKDEAMECFKRQVNNPPYHYEAIQGIIHIHRKKGEYKEGYEIGKQVKIPFERPSVKPVMCNDSVYEWALYYEIAYCAHGVGDADLAVSLLLRILKSESLPEDVRKSIRGDLERILKSKKKS